VLSFPSFICQTNGYSQFVLLLLRLHDTFVSSRLISQQHRCWTSILRHGICSSEIFSSSPLVASFTPAAAIFRSNLLTVAHSASTHSSFATTYLVHCALIVHSQHSAQLDNQAAMPLRTRRQGHFPTHQLAHQQTGTSSTTIPLDHSYSLPR
jgi:hypothetical protein